MDISKHSNNSFCFGLFFFLHLDEAKTTNSILICTRIGMMKFKVSTEFEPDCSWKIACKMGDYREYRLIVGNGLWTRQQSKSIAQMKITWVLLNKWQEQKRNAHHAVRPCVCVWIRMHSLTKCLTSHTVAGIYAYIYAKYARYAYLCRCQCQRQHPPIWHAERHRLREKERAGLTFIICSKGSYHFQLINVYATQPAMFD